MSTHALSLTARRSSRPDQATAPHDTAAGGTRFIVLGLLAITDGREVVALHPSKPATLLAALLLHANSVMPVDFLLRVIWGEDCPATAKSALHTCVLRLRRLFGSYGIAGNAIEALPGGYRIAADAGTLDLIHFRDLLGRAYAEDHPAAELALLRQALELWQTPVLGNVNSEVLHRYEVPRLTEEWLRAVERVFDIELAQGRHGAVLAELRQVASAHPVHERFREQLIEALYRSGRRAEALAEYRQVKEHLAYELGVDPGPALQRLELAILRGEPPAAGARAGRADPDFGAASFRWGAELRPSSAEQESGSRVLRILLRAGLLEKGPDGDYRMTEILHALTRAAEKRPN